MYSQLMIIVLADSGSLAIRFFGGENVTPLSCIDLSEDPWSEDFCLGVLWSGRLLSLWSV